MNANELEQNVVATLNSIWERYQLIDRLADELLTGDASLNVFDEKMKQLTQNKNEIEQMQLQSSQMNQQYRDTNQHASDAVDSLSKRITSLLPRLIIKMSELERIAKGTCDQLLPQIHDGVQAIRMQQAYSRYG